MSDALQSALAKAERRKEQPCRAREPYTRDEAQAMMAYANTKIRAHLGTRAERKVANKAAWAAGHRSGWK